MFLLCVCLCFSVTYMEEKEKIKKTEGVCAWGERKPQKVWAVKSDVPSVGQ